MATIKNDSENGIIDTQNLLKLKHLLEEDGERSKTPLNTLNSLIDHRFKKRISGTVVGSLLDFG